jgi:T-complex protein 1 subunit gamma
VLRGGSKDTLNEMERNLHDALGVARNLFADPRLLFGGGAVEMQIQQRLLEKAKDIIGL